MTLRQQIFQRARRIVLKLGTTILTDENQQIDSARISGLVEQIAQLTQRKKEFVLVSSGAIGAGMAVRGLKARPAQLETLQAIAAIGQIQLMKLYEERFRFHGITVSQVLLTRADLADRKRYVNVQKTLAKLLEWKAIPIINENDTVAVDEIKVGDNDQLSSLVAHLVDADLLVLLSNVDGLYPHGKISDGAVPLDVIEEITPELVRWARPTRAQTSVGGMVTKLEAAKMATQAGIPCVLANGGTPGILFRLFEAEELGTLFTKAHKRMRSKKRWLAFTTRPKGAIQVDGGAQKALIVSQRSLLASGILEVEGTFQKGDLIRILGPEKNEFARGISSFSSELLKQIKGLRTDQIKQSLGTSSVQEVIHRDRLVIL